MIEPDASIVATAVAGSNGDLLRFERLLAIVSPRFIDLLPGRIDAAITEGLQRIVAMLGVDRSTLSGVDHGVAVARCTRP